MIYIYLCHGFPAMVHEDERRAYDGHQLVAIFGDPMVAWLTYTALRKEAVDACQAGAGEPRTHGPSAAPSTAARRPGSSPASLSRHRR